MTDIHGVTNIKILMTMYITVRTLIDSIALLYCVDGNLLYIYIYIFFFKVLKSVLETICD